MLLSKAVSFFLIPAIVFHGIVPCVAILSAIYLLAIEAFTNQIYSTGFLCIAGFCWPSCNREK